MDTQLGHIYKIIARQGGECYVGSTFQELRYRWTGHKCHYKRWKDGKSDYTSSYDLFERYGVDNCQIVLIKSYEVVDRRHLEMYETLWVCRLKPVNEISPFRITWLSRAEWLQNNKEYYKQYRVDNRPRLLEQQKHYYEKNKPKLLERMRQYRLDNKAHIQEKAREQILCECGSSMRRNSLSTHKKSKKHQDAMLLLVETQ